MTLRRVLVGTDLSEFADEALRQAHELASTDKIALGVCHVVPREVFIHPLFPQTSRDEALELPELRERVAEAVAARVRLVTGRPAGSFEIFIEEGSPSEGIVRVAEDWKADRIVVGSFGATGIVRMLIGNVALSVARYAHCPVLVARARPGTGKIVVGTDFSDPALPALAAAADEAHRTSGRVTVIHSVELPGISTDVFGGALGDYSAQLAAYQRANEEAAERSLGKALAGAGIEADRQVAVGPAAANIVRLAEDLRADLIVVGTRGRTGLRRMVLGSVAEAVVRSAPCSVLVVRLDSV